MDMNVMKIDLREGRWKGDGCILSRCLDFWYEMCFFVLGGEKVLVLRIVMFYYEVIMKLRFDWFIDWLFDGVIDWIIYLLIERNYCFCKEIC